MTETPRLTENMRQVEPDAIESGLDNSWRTENAAVLAAGGHAGTRSSVLTLVAYASDETSAERTLRAIEALTTQHPSRSIIVTPVKETDSGRPLEAYINTRAMTANGATSYGEEIVLCATQNTSQHLAGSILPLIVSGLPSFLWWEGVPPWNAEHFEATLDGFDRALVDTAEMPQVEHNLLALEDLVRRKKSSVAISDFNFTRFSPWRELVAQFFDPPEHRAYLSGVEHVTIEYAAGEEDSPANTAQAYLFAGWLASRLGWRPVGASAERLVDGQREHTLLDTVGHKITLELNARYGVALGSWLDIAGAGEGADVRPLVGPGALMSVYIRAQMSGATASFTAAREADLRHASTHSQVPQGVVPSQTVHLPTLGEQASLGEELLQLGHDSLFESALAAITPALEPGLRRVRR
ncbi:MAG TPA: glucose-6-phosphate dehydrogenase assembly protein OpcA [Ktedonobacterales bacterium]